MPGRRRGALAAQSNARFLFFPDPPAAFTPTPARRGVSEATPLTRCPRSSGEACAVAPATWHLPECPVSPQQLNSGRVLLSVDVWPRWGHTCPGVPYRTVPTLRNSAFCFSLTGENKSRMTATPLSPERPEFRRQHLPPSSFSVTRLFVPVSPTPIWGATSYRYQTASLPGSIWGRKVSRNKTGHYFLK